jgi:hypothetical protein
MCRQAGDAKEQVNLHLTDAENRLQSRLCLCPACHPTQLVTILEINILKSSRCQPDILIGIQLSRVRNFFMMMRIPSTIPILIQIL